MGDRTPYGSAGHRLSCSYFLSCSGADRLRPAAALTLPACRLFLINIIWLIRLSTLGSHVNGQCHGHDISPAAEHGVASLDATIHSACSSAASPPVLLLITGAVPAPLGSAACSAATFRAVPGCVTAGCCEQMPGPACWPSHFSCRPAVHCSSDSHTTVLLSPPSIPAPSLLSLCSLSRFCRTSNALAVIVTPLSPLPPSTPLLCPLTSLSLFVHWYG